MNIENIELKAYKRQMMNMDATQTHDAKLLELFESIERLRTVLNRLTTLSDKESIELVSRLQIALKTLNDEISRVFVLHKTDHVPEPLQNQDNEGGIIGKQWFPERN